MHACIHTYTHNHSLSLTHSLTDTHTHEELADPKENIFKKSQKRITYSRTQMGPDDLSPAKNPQIANCNASRRVVARPRTLTAA